MFLKLLFNSLNMMHQVMSKISILMTGMITLKPLKLNTYSGLRIPQAAFIQLSALSSHALAMLRVEISVFGSQGAG